MCVCVCVGGREEERGRERACMRVCFIGKIRRDEEISNERTDKEKIRITTK